MFEYDDEKIKEQLELELKQHVEDLKQESRMVKMKFQEAYRTVRIAKRDHGVVPDKSRFSPAALCLYSRDIKSVSVIQSLKLKLQVINMFKSIGGI